VTSLLLLALVACIAGIAVAAKMEFAIEGVHAWWPDHWQKSLQRLQQLGITHIRSDVWMHEFDPCRKEEMQSKREELERVIAGAHGASPKITIQLTLGAIAAKQGRPSYHGAPCPEVPKAHGIAPNPKDFGAFVAREVKHWYDRGVRRFSLWNEPNLNFFLCAGDAREVQTDFMEDQVKCFNATEKKAAKLYYNLYRSGYGAIKGLQKAKAIGNDIQIVFGEIAAAHHGIKFVDAVLKHGKLKADSIAIHPYQFCTDPTSKKRPGKNAPCKRWMPGGMGWINDWNKAVAKWAKSGRLRTVAGKKPSVLLTEFGYLISPPPANIPENFRAKWYPKAMDLAKKAKVKQMLIFGLHAANNPAVWDSGIINGDSTPLPSFCALRKWAAKNGYKQIPMENPAWCV